ncbi:GAF domain-containing hybrid sensor histidine kinase/response regulator [Desulfovibrio sp. TomC]|uniref:GAF domain-containing hybrid sensor histidine kinase/response regulator n=1 Tax=Desulfovibrio sp. TomC TaxID=1562888 RepID=UPI00057469B0|nr:ATP-binding protein [Desulfovibrio sp. TomC]KHK01134.1 Signal transduction histidine kinase [Desulfovibrio sp. TomC]
MAKPLDQPPVRGFFPALAAGCATSLVLALGLLTAADWYRMHLWLVWEPWRLNIFYLTVAVCVLLPGGLVGLLVDRERRLRCNLSGQGAEILRARADLDRTHRALVALSSINHELIRATDREGLFSRIGQILVEQSGYSLVWVGIIEPGPEKRLRVAARAGQDSAWLDTLDAHWDASPRGHGPTGTAVREARLVIMANMQDEPFFKDWPNRPAGLDRYHSALSLPLRVAGRPAGAITIYETAQRDFSDEEVGLLTQMADDVSYGLEFMRLGLGRERTSKLLRQALRTGAAMSRTALELAAGGQDLRALASHVLQHALWLTGSPLGAVGIVVRPTGRLDWLAVTQADGTIRPLRPEECDLFQDDGGRFGGPFAATLNEGVPLRVDRPTTLEGFGPAQPGLERVSRFLALPLRPTGEEPRGLILLADAAAPYADRDIRAVGRLSVLFEMAVTRRQVEEELISARRRAEAASEAKTQFLANISHELRTPINGILGMAQLAVLEGKAVGETEYWQTVRDATDRLVEIVDNLLELANVESGSLSPMLREFGLRRLLDSLRSSFSIRAGLAGLTFDLNVDATLPDKLLGDPFRLRQILSNLIDNAIRFTPAGGISVQVRRYEPTQSGGTRRVFVAADFSGVSLVFSVTDTGIGIAADKLAAIFESFALGEDYLTKRYGGTGMGLSIARRLAELLGGSIWVESQPAYGSTFYLTVPMWPVVAELDAPPSGEAEMIPLPPLRIMVVEDEAINRLALARGLRKLGHDVIEAGNGEDALRRLSMERVDVVIMDVQMPVMDGLTAVAHIRNGEVPGTNRRLPVVALTAYALEGDRQRFLNAGMDEFVTKPCDMDQLLRAVAKVVEIKPAG